MKRSARVILLAIMAILLCAAPCGAYDGILTVGPTDIVNLGTNYAPDYIGVSSYADVYGTLNMYSGAYVASGIFAFSGSEVNIYDSAIDNGFLTALYGANVANVANVTVYGPKFEIGTTIYTPPQDIEINDVLKVLSEDETQVLFSLLIYSGSTEIHLRAQIQDPEQLLEELSLYILDQVDQYQKPVPPDIELRGIAPELEASLLAKVNAALATLEKGNPNNTKVVMNNMKAFVNQVSAQTDKKVSEEASEVIIGSATAVDNALGNL